jgi:hypothetical protein
MNSRASDATSASVPSAANASRRPNETRVGTSGPRQPHLSQLELTFDHRRKFATTLATRAVSRQASPFAPHSSDQCCAWRLPDARVPTHNKDIAGRSTARAGHRVRVRKLRFSKHLARRLPPVICCVAKPRPSSSLHAPSRPCRRSSSQPNRRIPRASVDPTQLRNAALLRTLRAQLLAPPQAASVARRSTGSLDRLPPPIIPAGPTCLSRYLFESPHIAYMIRQT